MRSGYGQCVQDTIRRSLVFGPFNILIPYLQYMYASPSTTRGIDTMYDERCGLHDGVSAFKLQERLLCTYEDLGSRYTGLSHTGTLSDIFLVVIHHNEHLIIFSSDCADNRQPLPSAIEMFVPVLQRVRNGVDALIGPEY
jgi:hypothetical protein